MTITLLHGDNTAILPTLDAGSVQCVVTSPPYYGLRDYKLSPTDWPAVEYTPVAGLQPVSIPAQRCCLGLEADPLAYVAHLVHVWRLLWRVLRDDGVCWLNLGDSYNSQAQYNNGRSSSALSEQHKVYRETVDDQKWPGHRPLLPNLKNKDLLMIPARVALALQADGWYLRSDVIWAKPNPMPESVTDRPTKSHEYLFLLAKSERYFYDAEAIAEPATQHAQGTKGEHTGLKYAAIKDVSASTLKDADRTTRNRRTVWSIATRPYSGAHFAVMPEALIAPCVKAGSAAQACEHCGAPWGRVIERESDVVNLEEGRRQAMRSAGAQNGGTQKVTLGVTEHIRRRDLGFRPTCRCANTGTARSIVLDPFAGSGTVMRVAESLGRDSIGIDLNGDYVDLQEQRTNGVQVTMEGLL